jgi:1,2-phenylacetyl-CoA epoxidase catalytic subunit
MGSISARKVALDTGLDQEKTKDLLEYLAQREQVQNMGTERNGDWVPRAPDYPVGF